MATFAVTSFNQLGQVGPSTVAALQSGYERNQSAKQLIFALHEDADLYNRKAVPLAQVKSAVSAELKWKNITGLSTLLCSGPGSPGLLTTTPTIQAVGPLELSHASESDQHKCSRGASRPPS